MKKRTSKHIVSKIEVARFNEMREKLIVQELSLNQIREQLNECMGYSKAYAMLRALCEGENPPIIRVRRGVYCVSPHPVYIQRLQTCWDMYTRFANPQYYKDGKFKYPISIESAIQLLKEAGYKIFAPTQKIEYVEV